MRGMEQTRLTTSHGCWDSFLQHISKALHNHWCAEGQTYQRGVFYCFQVAGGLWTIITIALLLKISKTLQTGEQNLIDWILYKKDKNL